MFYRLAFETSFRANFLAAITSAFILTNVSQAQFDTDVPALTKKLDDAANRFGEVKRKAKATTALGFDRMISQIKNSKMSATVKADKVSEIASAKREFESNGTFPPDAEYVNLQLKYFLEINRSYRSLSRMHDQLMDAALKANDETQQRALQEKRRALDAQLPGVGAFVASSFWAGTLSLATGNSVKYSLRVEKLTGNAFRGFVTDNPQVANHPEYQVEGSLDGLAIKFRLVKPVQGGTVAANFSGILTGDHIIGTLDQANAKGKRFSGVVKLSLRP